MPTKIGEATVWTLKEILDQPFDVSGEVSYRDGYYDGVDQVLRALERGVSIRQIKAWHASKVFDWRYKTRRNGLVFPPKIPDAWGIIRRRILEKYNYTCAYCGDEANHVDHVFPVTRGGTDDDDNLVAACRDCNLSKGKKTLEEWERFKGFYVFR